MDAGLEAEVTVEEKRKPANFLEALIEDDLRQGRVADRVATRFPPEPNGYLHIGHAKSICLNFGLARDFQGTCNLRFDDTDPTKEDIEYVESIKHDVQWLGFQWHELRHASDYFEQFYAFAEALIKMGKAYVDSLNEEEIRAYRGTVTEPGKPSPYRDRSVEENLDLFRRMRAGEFPDGAHVLRGKIDMASPNMKMRDPVFYRIRHARHYRTGDAWCIYPLYDFAHCLSDAIEGITHSLCTLEFENNRDIYDWILDEAPDVPYRSHQYEFARLFLNYTVMSKRKLLQLVEKKIVSGWDDPRMPTLAGMRRRGYSPAAIQDFCERIGVAKANSLVDIGQLEFSVRHDLDKRVPRVMAVIDPIRIVIENWPEERAQMLNASLFPHDVPLEGSRELPFGREIWIDRADFSEDPPKGFYRLAPGREVRLRHAYVIRCHEVVRKDDGTIDFLRCSYDPDTLGVNPVDRKVKGAIHWLSVAHAQAAEIRLYDRLFTVELPDGDKERDFKEFLNPESLRVVSGFVEPSIAADPPASSYQFERLGFFIADAEDHGPGKPVYNRIVGLRDSWAKNRKAPQQAKVSAPAPKRQEKPIKSKDPSEGLDEGQKVYWRRYTETLGLDAGEAAVIAGNSQATAMFEEAQVAGADPTEAAKWVANDFMRLLKEWESKTPLVQGKGLKELLDLIREGVITTKIARDVFLHMAESGAAPAQIVEEKELRQVTDTNALALTIDGVLSSLPDEVSRFRQGEKKLMGFFVGQVMKVTGGKANPKLVNQLLRKKL